MKTGISVKHLQISKTESMIIILVAATVAVSVFCLLGIKSLLGQAAYQRRVLHARREAVTQLKNSIASADTLINQYKTFDSGDPTNIIGGRNVNDPSVNPPDGNNGRIILDALPSKYDFPALVSSMSKILNDDGITAASLQGSDQSDTVSNDPTVSPTPVAIPLSVSGSTSYDGAQKLVADLERSIRPFDISALSIQGSISSMSVSVTMNTYYQQPKSLNVANKDIR